MEAGLAHLRQIAADAEASIAKVMRETAVPMNASEVPMRGIATVLGVSHQRVGQIIR